MKLGVQLIDFSLLFLEFIIESSLLVLVFRLELGLLGVQLFGEPVFGSLDPLHLQGLLLERVAVPHVRLVLFDR